MVHSKNKFIRAFTGFTLVELVVVITILAILGTIGFLSIGGYSSRARDSERTADVALVSKSLDLSIINSGNYPIPDGYFTVTYSGWAVWYQGTVGNNVIQQLHASISGGGLDSKPTDPLKKTDLTYSTLAFGKAYQIKTEYEGDAGMAMDGPGVFIREAYAAAGNPTVAYIKGNYGGFTAKTVVSNGTGNLTYVIAIPSIVTGSGITSGSLVEMAGTTLSGTLQFNGKNLVGASSYNPGATTAVVFSGASLPADDSTGKITAMVTALKAAYSGSDIASNSSISTLLNTPAGGLASLGTSILTEQLGGTSGGGTGTSSTPANGACGSANGVATGSTPVSGLCNAGNPSAVTGSGPWAWTCVGTNGGTTANCSASMTQANPTSLAVSHSSRSKTFTFSWTAGSGNGGACKIQYLRNGSTWTDVSATTYNCDTTLSNQSVTLPADGWWSSGSWNGAQLRAMRTNDGANLGVFPQTLSCSSAGGSASSTPSIDEDCNGTWDNTTSSTSADTPSSCNSSNWNNVNYSCPSLGATLSYLSQLNCSGGSYSTFTQWVGVSGPGGYAITPSTDSYELVAKCSSLWLWSYSSASYGSQTVTSGSAYSGGYYCYITNCYTPGTTTYTYY